MSYLESVAVICLLLFVRSSRSEDICREDSPNCSLSGSAKKDSPVLAHCLSQQLRTFGPCCRSADNSTILGIDLGFCGVSSLVGFLDQLTYVTDMSIKNTNISCNENNFVGLKRLEHLWLSEICDRNCPGSSSAWVNASDTECIGQNFCKGLNETCPNDGGMCENNGPGLYHCICKPDYHGYRCLQQGKFPAWQFTAIIGSPTIVLSAVLWYFTLHKTIPNNS